MEEDRRPVRRPHHPHPHQRQLLVHGRHRTLRPVLGDFLRPRGGHPRRPARLAGRGRRPVRGDLEPGLHAVRPAGRRDPQPPAQALHRHRHGAGAVRHRDARRAQRLRGRPLPYPDRGQRGGDGGEGRGRLAGVPPDHRRPPAHRLFPDRRRNLPLQRGPRLCAAPHPAPRHAPRPPPGRQRAPDAPPRPDPDRGDGRGLPRTGPRPAADRGDFAPGGGTLPPHPRPRHGPAR